MQRSSGISSTSRETPHNFHFLVLGPGRGGTSLLQSCLDAHSRLAVAYECAREELLGFGIPHADFTNIVQERTRLFMDKCLAEAEKSRPKLWGNKITTEQLFALTDQFALNPPYKDVAELFFEQTLPDAPVVFIMRDGRSCIASKVKRTRQPLILATFRWRYAAQVYRYLREQRGKTLGLRFEDLLANPEQELRKVCDFLGVEFEPRMLCCTHPSMPPEYLQPGFDTGKARVPDTPKEILEYIRDDLTYCGYE